MPAYKRHSRTPVSLMADEARLMIKAAEGDDVIRDAVEIYTGRAWASLGDSDKVNALIERDQVARAAGAMAGRMRGMRDLKNETELARYGIDLQDRAVLLEGQIAELQSTIERITEDNRQLRATLVALNAQPAMAVNSK